MEPESPGARTPGSGFCAPRSPHPRLSLAPEAPNRTARLAQREPSELLPFGVAVLLDELYVLFVERPEARLPLEVVLDAREALRRSAGVAVDGVAPVLVFGEVPQAAVHGLAGHLDGLVGRVAPARRAGREHVQKARAMDVAGLLHLAQQVGQVAGAGCGGVGNGMGGHDLKEALLVGKAAVHVLAGRRGGGPGTVRRERAALDARIHIRLVVVADVEHVVVAVDSAGQRLQAYVGSAAIAGKAHHGAVLRLDALRLKAGLNAGEDARSGGEGRNHGVVGKGQLREVEAHGAHAAGWQGGDGVRAQDLEHLADDKRPGAAGAGLVPKEELVIGHGTGVDGHRAPSPSCA